MSRRLDELAAFLLTEMQMAQNMSARYKQGSEQREAYSAKAEQFRDAAHALAALSPAPVPEVRVKELDALDEMSAAWRSSAKDIIATTYIEGQTGEIGPLHAEAILAQLAAAGYELRIRSSLSLEEGEKP